MDSSRAKQQNQYQAEKNSQLRIVNGSYLLRLIITNHPIIKGRVSINIGVLSKNSTINTNYFYNTEKTCTGESALHEDNRYVVMSFGNIFS